MLRRRSTILVGLVSTALAMGAACGSSDDRKTAQGDAGEAGRGGEPSVSSLGGSGAETGTPDDNTSGHGGGNEESGGAAQSGAPPLSSAGAAGAAVVDGEGGASAGPCERDPANGACAPLFAALSGLRWELPCTGVLSANACSAADVDPVVAELSGVPDGEYQVTLRFRGVIELESYTPLPTNGTWVEGATPAHDGNNIYSLEISDPAQVYYLNAGFHQPYCQAVDEEHTVTVRAGAKVTLSASAVDGAQVANIDASDQPIVVPEVPPAPSAYNGQFVQMDVVQIARVP